MSYQPVIDHGPLPESSFVSQARARIAPPRVTTAMTSGRVRRRGVTEDIPEDVPQSSQQTSDNARGMKRHAKGGGGRGNVARGGRGNATGGARGNSTRGGRGRGMIFVLYKSLCMKLLLFVVNFHVLSIHVNRKWKDWRSKCKRRWTREWWKSRRCKCQWRKDCTRGWIMELDVWS